MKLPVKLIRTEWPPNEGLESGNDRFDAVYFSIKKNGMDDMFPLTIRLDWTVIDGCHRLAAARQLGIEYIEVRVWTGAEFVQ